MMRTVIVAAVIVAQPLVSDDVLEPSVLNEVEHALARAPTNAPPVTAAVKELPAYRALFPTGGVSRTARAIRLVSAQKSDGRWRVGTNDVTAAACRILKTLAE